MHRLAFIWLVVLLGADHALGFMSTHVIRTPPSQADVCQPSGAVLYSRCVTTARGRHVLQSKRNRATSVGPRESEEIRLRPAKDALERILWDPQLDAATFTVGFVDRYKQGFTEVKCDAPNNSIKGPSRLFVQALPEHRIAYIKYHRRVVWHKTDRIDRIFGSGRPQEDGSVQRIDEVLATYDDWLAQSMARKQMVWSRVGRLLGDDKLEELKQISKQVLIGAISAKEYVALATSEHLLGYAALQCEKAPDAETSPEEPDSDGSSEEPPLLALISTMPEEYSAVREQVLACIPRQRKSLSPKR